MKIRGILMLISFFGILAVIFSPIFPGKNNGLDYMDNLFNTISKGSSYFIPKAMTDSEKFVGKNIDLKIKMENEQQATDTAKLLQEAGAQVQVTGKELAVKGDAGHILKSCLTDADFMFKNDGKPIADKYGFSERKALYDWWVAFKAIGNELTVQSNFELVKSFSNVQKKALEPAYNYYNIEAKSWEKNIFLIVCALGFYVFYTLWYGFGLLYLFEGIGLKIGH
ncbi:MAG: hypothetical protein P4L42_11850 [Desulfocapsaceae bacterium]|nr:hypothetical protein [Desulfocapsaceae bacterium]